MYRTIHVGYFCVPLPVASIFRDGIGSLQTSICIYLVVISDTCVHIQF